MHHVVSLRLSVMTSCLNSLFCFYDNHMPNDMGYHKHSNTMVFVSTTNLDQFQLFSDDFCEEPPKLFWNDFLFIFEASASVLEYC